MQGTENGTISDVMPTDFFITILVTLLVIVIIVSIVKSLMMEVGGGYSSSKSKSKPKKEKEIMECNGCSEPFVKKDKFCGKCGYDLHE